MLQRISDFLYDVPDMLKTFFTYVLWGIAIIALIALTIAFPIQVILTLMVLGVIF